MDWGAWHPLLIKHPRFPWVFYPGVRAMSKRDRWVLNGGCENFGPHQCGPWCLKRVKLEVGQDIPYDPWSGRRLRVFDSEKDAESYQERKWHDLLNNGR